MIIGNGLLAQAFSSEFSDDADHIIFASGVSNSQEDRPQAFARERELLLSTLAENKKLVYFSTCSVHDPALSLSLYVRHKIEMEKLILNSTKNMVFRLPQVVGKTQNPHTLTNYLYRQISTRSSFKIWLDARRYLIDVADVASIAAYLIKNDQSGGLITNISYPHSISILDLVGIFENLLEIPAIYDTVNAGAAYEIDTLTAKETAIKIGTHFNQDYVRKTIHQYYA